MKWRGATVIAEGDAIKGPWEQNDSRYDYVDDPSVALGPDGRSFVAWVDQGRKDIFLQTLSATGHKQGAPINVSRNPDTFSWLPRVALAPHDARQVFVIWQEIVFSGGSHGGDIFLARSSDGGKSFSLPLNLSRSVGGDGKGRINAEVWHNGSLDLAVGADGAVYAAWTDYEGTLWLAVSSDRGETFTAPRRIAGEARRPARAPALAISPDRKLYLAWTLGEEASADIHVARSIDGGATFEAPALAARTAGYSDAPKLAVDSRNALHLAFSEAEGGPFTRQRVAYTRSVDGARSWERLRTVSPPGGSFPSIGLDAAGSVVLVWESSPEAGSRPHGLGIAVSRDGGERFSAPALVPGSRPPSGAANGNLQGRLTEKLAVNADGRLAVVNSSFEAQRQSAVWLLRGALPRSRAGAQDGGMSAARNASARASGVR